MHPPNSADTRRLRRLAMDQCRALVGALSASARAVETGTGLTNAQLFALRCLAGGTRMSAGALARAMDARPNALTPVLRRLEAHRLIRRLADPRDGRRALFEVTVAGHRILADAPSPPAERLLVALGTLPPARLEGFTAALGAVLRHLGAGTRNDSLLFESPDA